MDDFTSGGDSILDMYLFESNQLLEQLEEIMLETENSGTLSEDGINQIFRIMHTIKGSSAMMNFDCIAKTAHSLEDLFYYIRDKKPQDLDISAICDLVLSVSDFIKAETGKIQAGGEPDGDSSALEQSIHAFLAKIGGGGDARPERNGPKEEKHPASPENQNARPDIGGAKKYKIRLCFEDGSQMENIRAYAICNNIRKIALELYTVPKDILNSRSEEIMMDGFTLYVAANCDESRVRSVLEESLYLKSYDIVQVESYEDELVKNGLIEPADGARKTGNQPGAPADDARKKAGSEAAAAGENARNISDALQKNSKLSLISVNVNKLDVLMDVVGEIVISESMVTKNTDLRDLKLENFNKAARQLRKLTDELQDIVMSIRMIPIAGTFQKMHRIVRDMGRKLGKEVDFVTDGENTEVDKNIVDHLSDPLMHLIRNSMDHGIETEAERVAAGKPPRGKITLGAANTGGEIVITVSDDGMGIDKEKILEKARAKGLITKPDGEITEKEIYSCIMLPGFSTNDQVTEYSGRGVGMDVVRKNIEEVGGSVSVSSTPGKGTATSIIIPLTLAIEDAMEISVGQSVYTLPMLSIKESFRPDKKDVIRDENGNEMIMIRGSCYPIIRLHKLFGQHTEVTNPEDGILIMAEGDGKSACLFVDGLIGEQQVVVKPLPQYFYQFSLKDNGIEGCTILGDGSISLILNAKNIIGCYI